MGRGGRIGRGLLIVLACFAAATLTAASARAGTGFFFGFADDGPKWDGSAAVQPARDIGAGAFRVTLHWNAGESDLTSQDIADLSNATSGTTGLRLVLAVYGSPASAPQDDASRTQFCTFAKNAVARFPSIDDVVIWNEPNVSAFWRPQFNADGSSAAPAAYEALLARCWDVLHAFRPTINVIGPATSPRGNDNPNAASNISHSPVNFIERIGLSYRASGRTNPLLDTVGQHVYQNFFAERPFLPHGRQHDRRGRLEEARADASRCFRRHRPTHSGAGVHSSVPVDLVPGERLPDERSSRPRRGLHRLGERRRDPRLRGR
jgi:hypothetical protein